MSNTVFRSWRGHLPWSIILTPETELFNDIGWVVDPPFDTWKDIVIPGGLDLVEIVDLDALTKPLENRTHLASFIGTADVVRGPHPWIGGVDVRKKIVELAETEEGVVVMQAANLMILAFLSVGISEYLGYNSYIFIRQKQATEVHRVMGESTFCLIPRGKSAWSLRFFEALFAMCIPVLLSDLWELPLEDLLDVAKFVIKWPMNAIDQLVPYLRTLSKDVVGCVMRFFFFSCLFSTSKDKYPGLICTAHTNDKSYMGELRRVRCWFSYPPNQFDVRSTLNVVCPSNMNMFTAMLQLFIRRKRSHPTFNEVADGVSVQ